MKRYYLLPFWVFLGIVVGFVLNRSCTPAHTEPIKQPDIKPKIERIKTQKSEAIILHDTVIKYRTKYRYLRDTLIYELPCDTVLKLIVQTCDSIVVKDSLLISKQSNIILTQDSLISDYKVITHNDTIEINRLGKEVKKQKRQKWFIAALGVLGLGASVSR